MPEQLPFDPTTGNKRFVWYYPPGVWEDPPTDRRRWHARLIVPHHTLVFNECMQPDNVGRWAVLCVTNAPEGITHRIRTGGYGPTKHGRWEAAQRSLADGSGYSRVFVKCVESPGHA